MKTSQEAMNQKILVFPHILECTEDLLERTQLLLSTLADRCSNTAFEEDEMRQSNNVGSGNVSAATELLYEISYVLPFIACSLEHRRDFLGEIRRTAEG